MLRSNQRIWNIGLVVHLRATARCKTRNFRHFRYGLMAYLLLASQVAPRPLLKSHLKKALLVYI